MFTVQIFINVSAVALSFDSLLPSYKDSQIFFNFSFGSTVRFGYRLDEDPL